MNMAKITAYLLLNYPDLGIDYLIKAKVDDSLIKDIFEELVRLGFKDMLTRTKEAAKFVEQHKHESLPLENLIIQ